jgi:hypothetical protein
VEVVQAGDDRRHQVVEIRENVRCTAAAGGPRR